MLPNPMKTLDVRYFIFLLLSIIFYLIYWDQRSWVFWDLEIDRKFTHLTKKRKSEREREREKMEENDEEKNKECIRNSIMCP